MSEQSSSKSWWQSIPGVITGITAAITAVTGLIVALKQSGWFEPSVPAKVTREASSTVAAPAPPPPAAPAREESRESAPATPPQPRTASVPLPDLRDYKLGPAHSKATFTLLDAQFVPQSTEKAALQVRLRMMNHDRYDTNFWDRSFRLIVDGLPTAPDSNLNELVPAESAKEGLVTFSIPRTTAAAKLKITYHDDSTEIPLDLRAAR
jgi:hypothetical protein